MGSFLDNALADELVAQYGGPGEESRHTATPAGAASLPTVDRARVRSEKYCGFGSIVGSLPDKSDMITIPVRCKSWTCKTCAPRKCRAILARLLRGNPERDITLTMRASVPGSPRDQARAMKRAWSSLATKCRRVFGEFEYAVVFELTKKGTPHMHILQRGTYIPVAWLKREWTKHGLGHIVHIQKIRHQGHAAVHAVKYLGKCFGQTAQAIAPLHVVQFSKGYDMKDAERKPEPNLPDHLWTHTMEDADDIARRMLSSPRYISHTQDPDGTWHFIMQPIKLPKYADVSDPTYILDSGSRGPPSIDVPAQTP